ncbi:MAG TPA: hypothetical protein VKX96_07360 [Chloroflexota bacterium]|nr:hypothetical protein [Chloroflexota bacterium]
MQNRQQSSEPKSVDDIAAPAEPELLPASDKATNPPWVTRVDHEFALLALLFFCLRLAAVLFFRSGGNVYQGDHDVQFYRSIGELSIAGYYPYLNFWMEYPPIFAWAIVAIYQLSLLLPSWPNNLLWFQVFLSTVLVVFDVGNLILIYRLASILHSRQVALRAAWIYSLLFFPLYVVLSWFDTVALFFLLCTLWLALREQTSSAGVSAALGLMVKVIPVVAVPASFLALRRRSGRLQYVVTFLLASMAIIAPFYFANPTMLVASLRMILGRSSWESIWSFFEGYYNIAIVPLLSARFDPKMAEWSPHPATLPWAAITGTFFVLCLLLYTRPLDWHQPTVAVTAAALTLNLFLIFSKGFSPQFLVYPLALLVVVLPNTWGALYALVLTADDLLEYPFALGFFGDDHRLAWLVVIIRTSLFIWLSVEYTGLLFAYPHGWWAQWRSRFGALVISATVLGVIVSGGLSISHYFMPTRPDDAVPMASYLTAFAGPGQAAVASTRDAFYEMRPRISIPNWMLVQGDDGQWPSSVEDRVATLRQGKARVWVIIDQAGQNSSDVDKVVRSMDAWGSRASDVWFGHYHLLGYLPYRAPASDPSEPRHEDFAGVLALQGFDVSSQELKPGEGLAVILYFDSEASVQKDYKVFIHLVDAQGRIIAQNDRLLSYAGQGSAQWKIGTSDREGYDLLVPGTTACGTYTLLAGLYDPANGQRVKIKAGPSTGVDNVELTKVRVC